MAACAFPDPATLSYDTLLRWVHLVMMQFGNAADLFPEAGFCHTLISMVCHTSENVCLLCDLRMRPQSNPIIL